MYKKCITFLITSISLMVLSACGGGGSSNQEPSSSVNAPTSLSGNAYKLTITSGDGSFAKSGSYIVKFFNSSDMMVTGDITNVQNSTSTYTYTNSNNQGTVSYTSTIGMETIVFTFSSESSGTFAKTGGNTAPLSTQNGTFVLDTSCFVGKVLSVGQSCSYAQSSGNQQMFSVDSSNRGCIGGSICAGTNLSINDFTATKQADDSWKITALPSS